MIKINADDFGYSNVDNSSILFCFKNNVINSSTIMVNAPKFLEAVEISKKFSLSKFIGLHLNLTEFSPLTEEIKTNPKFVKNGLFYNNLKNRGFSSFLSFTRKDKKQIKNELEAQMKLFRSYFPDSTFLDSHHHIHTVYPILKIVLRLAKKYKFETLRISKNVPKSSNILKNLYKGVINKKILKEFPYSSSMFFDTFVENLKYVSNFKTRTINIEIMVHPLVDGCSCIDKLTGFDLLNLTKVLKE